MFSTTQPPMAYRNLGPSSPVKFPMRKAPDGATSITTWLSGDDEPSRMAPSYASSAHYLNNPGCCALIDANWLDQATATAIAIANRANPFLPHGGPLDPISPPEPKPPGFALLELRAGSAKP